MLNSMYPAVLPRMHCLPFLATNCAVLSTMALMSGAGVTSPIAWVWVSTTCFRPPSFGFGSTLFASPTATMA